MKLDWADGFETAAADTTTVTTVVPAGRHFGEIKSVKVNPGWKITDRNPSGDVLSIGIDFGTASQKMEWIWQAIPTNWPRKIIEVCQCAVAVNPQPNVDWDEQCLLGLTVFCETDTFILQNGPKTGQERGKVVSFVSKHLHPAQAGTVTTPKRTPAKKSLETFTKNGGGDEIPF